MPEDEERDVPFATSSTPDDDDVVERETEGSDDSEWRDADEDAVLADEDGDTDIEDDGSADDESTTSDGDTDPVGNDSAKGCSTVGQTHGGLMTLILGPDELDLTAGAMELKPSPTGNQRGPVSQRAGTFFTVPHYGTFEPIRGRG